MRKLPPSVKRGKPLRIEQRRAWLALWLQRRRRARQQCAAAPEVVLPALDALVCGYVVGPEDDGILYDQSINGADILLGTTGIETIGGVNAYAGDPSGLPVAGDMSLNPVLNRPDGAGTVFMRCFCKSEVLTERGVGSVSLRDATNMFGATLHGASGHPGITYWSGGWPWFDVSLDVLWWGGLDYQDPDLVGYAGVSYDYDLEHYFPRDDAWHNFVLTFSGDGGETTVVDLWRDGVYLTSYPVHFGAYAYEAPANPLMYAWSGAGSWTGSGIWNRVLTEPEIIGLNSLLD